MTPSQASEFVGTASAYALKWNVLAILPLFAMLAAVGSLGLAAALTGPEVRIVGAAVITFFVMRIAFWVGYRIRPCSAPSASRPAPI